MIEILSPILAVPPFVLSETVVEDYFILNVSLQANRTWLFTWNVDGSYKIVLQGRILEYINGTQYIYDLGGTYSEFPPPIEVVPVDSYAASEISKPYTVLQWFQIPNTFRYEVQEQVYDGTWRKVFTIKENRAQTYYTYISGTLQDNSTHKYRILAYNEHNDYSISEEYTITIVTPPILSEKTISVHYFNGDVFIEAMK